MTCQLMKFTFRHLPMIVTLVTWNQNATMKSVPTCLHAQQGNSPQHSLNVRVTWILHIKIYHDFIMREFLCSLIHVAAVYDTCQCPKHAWRSCILFAIGDRIALPLRRALTPCWWPCGSTAYWHRPSSFHVQPIEPPGFETTHPLD